MEDKPIILSPIDYHFAELMVKMSGKDSKELFLAAALASYYRGEGHICFDISSRAGKETMIKLSFKKGEEFSFDTAWTKHHWGKGQICFDISMKAEGQSKEKLNPTLCPELGKWLKNLNVKKVVGKPGDHRPLILDGSRLYLYRYWDYEKKLIDNIKARVATTPVEVNLKLFKDGLMKQLPENTTKEQKVAVVASIMKNFCVISGGPGTGKTYTVASILAIILQQQTSSLRIALTAPTGKAAVRLQETINNALKKINCPQNIQKVIQNLKSSTIHRLLKMTPDSPYPPFDAKNPLPMDLVVVDEASMIDLALMSKLIQAIPLNARLILLGDKDQLASVDAGAVLGDICDTGNNHKFSRYISEAYQKVTGEKIGEDIDEQSDSGMQDSIIQLRTSHRFKDKSGIGEVSQVVNKADYECAFELLTKGPYTDIKWRELPSLPAALKETILECFTPYLEESEPAKVFEHFNNFRILCAVREGPYGIKKLNEHVEYLLFNIRKKSKDELYQGRPILITHNDYNLKLFNGDIGITLPDPENRDKLRVFFPEPDGSFRKFPLSKLPEHETAFAMTVHKSQGSEFEKVLFLMPDRDVPVLTRELVYTAITRAKAAVEVWGREEIFKTAVSRRIIRASGLREALWG